MFVLTQDGSPTLYDEKYKEHHHSLIGAYTEARYKFVEPAIFLINSLVNNNQKIRLLDLPFGLGYNFIATLKYCDLNYKKFFLEALAVEKNINILEKINSFPADHELKNYFNILNFNILNNTKNNFNIKNNRFFLEVKIADLLELLPSLVENNKKFDIIMYDPFSPRVAPELWQKNSVLKYFHELLDTNGMFITYTASNKVRRGLLDLNFKIFPVPAVGRKSSGTLALKSINNMQIFKNLENFSQEMLEKILKTTSY